MRYISWSIHIVLFLVTTYLFGGWVFWLFWVPYAFYSMAESDAEPIQ